MAEARRLSERYGDGFEGPGGHSESLEAWRSFLRGLWRLCTLSLPIRAADPSLSRDY